MAERYSWAVSSAGGLITSEDARIHLGSGFQPGGLLVTDARSGWLPLGPGANNPGAVTANGTPNNSVNVAPFVRVQQSTRGKGPYIMVNDAAKAINILSTPAHATNPRNDLIIAQQSDEFYGDANSNMVIRHIVGTPAGVPADPAVTGSPDYVLLARVNVPANDTTIENGQITDLRPGAKTVAVGGVIPIASATERNAITDPFPGMVIYRLDRSWREVYTGGVWRVMDVATVAAYADLATHITNPYTNQIAMVTGDNALAVYSGSSWVYQMFFATTTNQAHARYRQTSAHSVPNVTDTKCRFQTAVNTSAEIVVTGTGNTDFELLRGGRWRIEANARYAAAAGLLERHIFICGSTNLVTPRYAGNQVMQTANAVATLSTSVTRRFSASQKISVGLFQNSGAAINTDPVFDEIISVSFTWEGP
jgi:hypothetical protein